ncbi:MAG: phosphatidate cytidylyltransferase [Cyanobacteria bacterium P01_F01_bin.150]
MKEIISLFGNRLTGIIAGFTGLGLEPLHGSPILWGLGGILGLLSVSSVWIWGLAIARPERDWTELQLRLRSWWWIVVIFDLALLTQGWLATVLFGLLSFSALKEYLSIIPSRRADRVVFGWAYLAVVFQYIWVQSHWYGMFLVFLPIYIFLFLPLPMVMLGKTEGFLQTAGSLHWGLILTVYNLSHLAYLLLLPDQASLPAGGQGLLLYLVFLTEVNDIAQYLSGKTWGQHKVVPNVSPNKTVEGLIGGVVVTTILSLMLAPWLTPFPAYQALFLGGMLSLTGFVGDVTVSALKRDLGIKDSGRMIPGHGGILDRVDSLTFTAPLFFHFTVYFYFHGSWLA